MSVIYDRVAEKLTSHLGVDPALVIPGVTFAELGMGSLELTELAVIIEDEFGIEVEGVDADSTLAEAAARLEEAAGMLSSQAAPADDRTKSASE
jgi:acyl carrier protein